MNTSITDNKPYQFDSYDIPPIERVYDVRLPNGDLAQINRFDLNLALAVGGDHYVQLTDTSWIKANRLTIVKKEKS
jgi:hypothetical protein